MPNLNDADFTVLKAVVLQIISHYNEVDALSPSVETIVGYIEDDLITHDVLGAAYPNPSNDEDYEDALYERAKNIELNATESEVKRACDALISEGKIHINECYSIGGAPCN